MIAKCVLAVGSEEREQFAPFFAGEAGADADVLKRLRSVIEAEEQRADLLAWGFAIPAKARNHAVAITFVLDLEHDALVGLVGKIVRLGDYAVEAGAFESPEPIERDFAIGCGRRDVDWRPGGFEQGFEGRTAFLKWLRAKVAIAIAKQIEEDAGRRSLLGEELYARGGGMNTQLQCVEIETAVMGDEEFAVEDAFAGKLLAERVDHLGEVAVERFSSRL